MPERTSNYDLYVGLVRGRVEGLYERPLREEAQPYSDVFGNQSRGLSKPLEIRSTTDLSAAVEETRSLLQDSGSLRIATSTWSFHDTDRKIHERTNWTGDLCGFLGAVDPPAKVIIDNKTAYGALLVHTTAEHWKHGITRPRLPRKRILEMLRSPISYNRPEEYRAQAPLRSAMRDVIPETVLPKRLWKWETGQIDESHGVGRWCTISHVWAETKDVDWVQVGETIQTGLGIDRIWLDQKCIIQEGPGSEEDKSAEIPKMAQYYAGAGCNVILALKTEMAGVMQRWVDRGCASSGEESVDAMNALRAFLESQYFSRVWTFQEMELARTNYVMCKDGLVPGWRLDALIRTAAGLGRIGEGHGEAPIWQDESIYSSGWRLHAEGMMFDHHWARLALSTGDWIRLLKRPLIELWNDHGDRCCQHPYDTVWGYAALAEEMENISVNYTTPIETVLQAAAANSRNPVDWLRVIQCHRSPSWLPRLAQATPSMAEKGFEEDNMLEHGAVRGNVLVCSAIRVDSWSMESDRVYYTIWNLNPRAELRVSHQERELLERSAFKRMWLVQTGKNNRWSGWVMVLDANGGQAPTVHKVGVVSIRQIPSSLNYSRVASAVQIEVSGH